MINPHHFFTKYYISLLHLKKLERFRMKLIKKCAQTKIQWLLMWIGLSLKSSTIFIASSQELLHPLKRGTYRWYRCFFAHDSSSSFAWSFSHDHFKKDKVYELKILVQKSVDSNNSSITLQVTQTIDLIALLNEQVKKVESNMKSIVKFLDSIIMTIPSIGAINVGIILEIGNITTSQILRRYLHLLGWIRLYINPATLKPKFKATALCSCKC